MSGIEAFLDRFKFDPKRAFNVGVERECFVADEQGQIVPQAHEVLAHIKEKSLSPTFKQSVGYELSACQVEVRTPPCHMEKLCDELYSQDRELSASMAQLGYTPLFLEVAPASMPLDVYPDPTGRYASMTKGMPREVLLAACRVIGTHVHVGMPDAETALRVYNRVIEECDTLCRKGDGSFGERLEIYKIMEPNPIPMPFEDWQNFFETAVEKGFAEDPRKCWKLIRISSHGTIEFRMFGATNSVPQILSWAMFCHDLCRKA